MQILRTKRNRGCLDSKNVYDIFFDKETSKDFVMHMSELGKLIYNDEFQKHFYRIISRGKFTLKGTVGKNTSRIILPENFDDNWLYDIENHVQKFNEIK